ncbi:MAG: efflux transporter outer membrane subunit [Rhodocyclaceae bacterium]
MSPSSHPAGHSEIRVPICQKSARKAAWSWVSHLVFSLTLALQGCATRSSALATPQVKAPAQWHTALPHGGQLTDLQQWWSQFDDPLMLRLIQAAQLASPSLAQAASNIAEARAARVASGSALLPTLDIAANLARERSVPATPASAVSSVGLQAGWELDLFGANRAGVDAATARLSSSQADWHDARVSVAAEVARNYVDLRECEAHVQQAELDADSRAQTYRITALAAAAGIQAPATTELARASAAQGRLALVTQMTQCGLLIKALVALTAMDEPELRRQLAERSAQLPQPTEFGVSTIPAEVLAQRPDVLAAAQNLAAAGAASAQADAQRWPRVTLAGDIGAASLTSAGVSTDGTVWRIGPVVITFPLFDGGTRHARAQAAKVHYETASTVYAARLRIAIQEVEGALLTLESTAQRSESARIATGGFERSYRATEAGYHAGAGSLFELEDARRSLVAAQRTSIALRRERLLAWIALYRSVGGGWTPTSSSHAVDPAGPKPSTPTR